MGLNLLDVITIPLPRRAAAAACCAHPAPSRSLPIALRCASVRSVGRCASPLSNVHRFPPPGAASSPMWTCAKLACPRSRAPMPRGCFSPSLPRLAGAHPSVVYTHRWRPPAPGGDLLPWWRPSILRRALAVRVPHTSLVGFPPCPTHPRSYTPTPSLFAQHPRARHAARLCRFHGGPPCWRLAAPRLHQRLRGARQRALANGAAPLPLYLQSAKP